MGDTVFTKLSLAHGYLFIGDTVYGLPDLVRVKQSKRLQAVRTNRWSEHQKRKQELGFGFEERTV